MSDLSAAPLGGLPEVRPDDDLAALLAEAAAGSLRDGDVLCVAHKVVSKVDGRVRRLGEVEPGERARELATRLDRDPRHVQVVLDEAVEVVRDERVLICRTRHGFVCANAGVDASNAGEPGAVVLLPLDPDASARALREGMREHAGVAPAVIVTDSFGRAWREGTTDVAIGAAGLQVLRDLHGERDPTGYELHATTIAVADEIAGAAELAMGKLSRVPVAVVRGLDLAGSGKGRDLVMPSDRDLFR